MPETARSRNINAPNGKLATYRFPVRPSDCGATAVESPAVVTVSVELDPGVTELGESPQVGVGAAPVTEHVRAIVPEKPPCAANVRVSLTWLPCITLRPVAAGFTEKSGATLNVAVTVASEFNVTEHVAGSVPVQAPLHPLKLEPD